MKIDKKSITETSCCDKNFVCLNSTTHAHWQDESTIIIKFFNSETKLESSIELQVSGDSKKRMLDIKDRS